MGSRELRVRQSPKTGWFVEGLREFLIRTPEEAMRFLASGDKRKHTAESKELVVRFFVLYAAADGVVFCNLSTARMNMMSSRSHTILRLVLESRVNGPAEHKPVIVSILNLVDLAGSESSKKVWQASALTQSHLTLICPKLTMVSPSCAASVGGYNR